MHTNELCTALKSPLKTIYLISGDVPLLVEETRNKIRKAALEQKFTENELLNVEPSFNYELLQKKIKNRSLFGERSFIDLRLSHWGKSMTEVINSYLDNPPSGVVVVISIGKLTSTEKKTSWYKRINEKGELITVSPLSREELSRWIQQRLHYYRVKTDSEGIQSMIDATEGNLLATQQVIQKLALLYSGKIIKSNLIMKILNDTAQFSVFDFSNAVLLGDKRRVVRIMFHLRSKGVEPTLILWSLVKEIRNLVTLLSQKLLGKPLHQLIEKEWQSRKEPVKAALQRQSYETVLKCLQRSSEIDFMIKGLKTQNCWNALELLALAISGKPNE